jgi:7,8-dihydroneopterin aldolase/epimerase/oxygenase
MITISLRGAEFFAYHGFYPEEQLLGARFIVDIEVDFVPLDDIKVDKLVNTVDYEKLHDIAGSEMKQTRKLIETVAQRIADKIKIQFPFVKTIRVSIKKLNPPLNGKVDYSSILVTV